MKRILAVVVKIINNVIMKIVCWQMASPGPTFVLSLKVMFCFFFYIYINFNLDFSFLLVSV